MNIYCGCILVAIRLCGCTRVDLDMHLSIYPFCYLVLCVCVGGGEVSE